MEFSFMNIKPQTSEVIRYVQENIYKLHEPTLAICNQDIWWPSLQRDNKNIILGFALAWILKTVVLLRLFQNACVF